MAVVVRLNLFCLLFFFFFFSSRRRHTRYIGDWSSDVCSSDLVRRAGAVCDQDEVPVPADPKQPQRGEHGCHHWREARSEERRVGKEWRARRAPEESKKKGEGSEGGRKAGRRRGEAAGGERAWT